MASNADGNVVINGDFQTGLLAPSTTAYAQSNDMFGEGTWNIVSYDTLHSFWVDYYDHTHGDATGRHMIINGTSTGAGPAWAQIVTVLPNTNYDLRAWFASLYPLAIASLEFRVFDGAQPLASTPFFAPSTLAVWEERSMTFNSGSATSLSIEIWDTNLSSGGNDYSIDDISLSSLSVTAVPEPAALLVMLCGLLFFWLRPSVISVMN